MQYQVSDKRLFNLLESYKDYFNLIMTLFLNYYFRSFGTTI